MSVAFHKNVKFGIVNKQSVGNSAVSSKYRKLFNPDLTKDLFRPIPTPKHKDDWLAQYADKPQSFDDWIKKGNNPIDGKRLVIVPIGLKGGGPDFQKTKEYLSAFFVGVEIIVMDELIVTEKKNVHTIAIETDDCVLSYALKHRKQSHSNTKHKYVAHHKQYDTSTFSDILKHYRDKHNAFAAVGATMLDLYMDETDEFSCGLAFMRDGIGIFSFARYSPLFQNNFVDEFKSNNDNNHDTAKSLNLLTSRSIKTLVHEILHLLGVGHCTFANCLMQGSGNLAEDFAIPHHMCLVDLHKLIYALSANQGVVIDVVQQFTTMAIIMNQLDEKDEANWLLKFISVAKASDSIVPLGSDDDNYCQKEGTTQKDCSCVKKRKMQ